MMAKEDEVAALVAGKPGFVKPTNAFPGGVVAGLFDGGEGLFDQAATGGLVALTCSHFGS
ncbi:MAG: hypothetical protein ACRDJB_07710 [Actinomycetota bacterium]